MTSMQDVPTTCRTPHSTSLRPYPTCKANLLDSHNICLRLLETSGIASATGTRTLSLPVVPNVPFLNICLDEGNMSDFYPDRQKMFIWGIFCENVNFRTAEHSETGFKFCVCVCVHLCASVCTWDWSYPTYMHALVHVCFHEFVRVCLFVWETYKSVEHVHMFVGNVICKGHNADGT